MSNLYIREHDIMIQLHPVLYAWADKSAQKSAARFEQIHAFGFWFGFQFVVGFFFKEQSLLVSWIGVLTDELWQT